ncbi:MAG: efflux RND transporter permease subunit, partial [Planctomycetota bacterium]
MLNWIIDFSLRNRGVVIVATLGALAFGLWSMMHIDIDAFPDTTPVMVQVNTHAPALGPEEIEQQITFPIEQALGGLPKVELLRSVSKFGLSQVVLIFQDGTDIYFARQVVNERLSSVELPLGITPPSLGPVSTGMDEVFHYIVTTKGDDITQARTIHDWMIKPKVRTVPGT